MIARKETSNVPARLILGDYREWAVFMNGTMLSSASASRPDRPGTSAFSPYQALVEHKRATLNVILSHIPNIS